MQDRPDGLVNPRVDGDGEDPIEETDNHTQFDIDGNNLKLVPPLHF